MLKLNNTTLIVWYNCNFKLGNVMLSSKKNAVKLLKLARYANVVSKLTLPLAGTGKKNDKNVT